MRRYRFLQFAMRLSSQRVIVLPRRPDGRLFLAMRLAAGPALLTTAGVALLWLSVLLAIRR